jgi:hypothetical protein
MVSVFKRTDHYRRLPYTIRMQQRNGRRLSRYFATVREAIVAGVADKICNNVLKHATRATFAHKRARDMALYGDNCALERRVADALVEAWTRLTTRSAIVLNDGTRADLLLECSDGTSLPVQLKTTHKSISTRTNQWIFTSVTGYSSMPVVCWTDDTKLAWVYDGHALDTRGKQQLSISAGGVAERLAMACRLTIDALVHFLDNGNHANWQRTTEHDARRDFNSQKGVKEMRGIDAYCQRFEGRYQWPSEQNGSFDLLDGNARIQFKTVHCSGTKAGFQCRIAQCCGKNTTGKQLIEPYPFDAFDTLVAVWFANDGTVHFWRIPAMVLYERGYLSDVSHKGKQSLLVHGPPGVGRAPNLTSFRKADTWTRDFYLL